MKIQAIGKHIQEKIEIVQNIDVIPEKRIELQARRSK